MLSLKITTYKKMLIGYWLLVPACFYLYLFMTSSMRQVAATELITNVPGITIAFLMASLMLIQSATVYFVQQISTSHEGLLGKYLSFSLFQQICTGNIVGAIICYFYKRSLYNEEESISTVQKISIISICVFLSLFSLLTLFVMWRLKGA